MLKTEVQAIDNILLTSLDLVEIKILILNRLNGEFKVLQPKLFQESSTPQYSPDQVTSTPAEQAFSTNTRKV